MKKLVIVLGGLVVVMALAAVLLPIIFKEDIKKAIDKELANNLNASAYYDGESFSLSVFRNFPNLTVSLNDFGVAGIGKFEGDTLIDVQRFSLSLDIMSVISGDQIRVKNIQLDKPVLQILVLEDGSANYDIAKSTATAEETTNEEEAVGVSVGIENWEINGADVVYYDQSLPFYVTLFGLDHSGNGDFRQEVFDMQTRTTINQLSLGMDGIEYLTNKSFSADVIMAMDLANMAFTFKENKVNLNDFGMGFDGVISMPGENIDIDLTFSGEEIDLEGIMSLIPGLYSDYLKGIDASGLVGFNGSVRGTVGETEMPKVVADLSVANGNIRYSEYPVPLEKINIEATLDYPSADLRETRFEVSNFSMELDGESVTASLLIKDLEDYFWDFALDGNMDFAKLTSIVPMDGMEIEGKATASIKSSGRMSDLEAEQYQKLKTSGSLGMTGFGYVADDLPQGLKISSLSASFNPDDITLAEFKGSAGRTDLNMSGQLTNYMGYLLQGDNLNGKLDFSSSLVDINEWMVPADTTEVEEEDTTTMEVIRIPTNIDFVLASSIDELVYDDLTIKNFDGSVVIRDGTLLLDKVDFNLFDGSFIMNGSYATAVPDDPVFSYDLEIKELSIPSAFRAFSTVRKLAPFAEKMNGKFSTTFNISGAVGEDMTPRLETLAGGGLLQIIQASLTNVKLLSAVSSVSSLDQQDGAVSLSDVLVQTEIKDGRVYVQPFEMTMGGYKTEIAGSNSIDGKLDYMMTVKNVSTGAAGQALNSVLSSFTGAKDAVASKVDINFGVGGDFTKPTVKLLGFNKTGSESTSTKTLLKTAAQEKVDAQKDEIKEEIVAKKDEVKEEAAKVVDEKKEEVKEEVDKAKEKAEDALKGLLGKKKKKKKKDGGGN